MANRKRLTGNIVAILVGLGMVAAIAVAVYSPRCASYQHHGIKYCTQTVWGGSNSWTEPLDE